MTTRELIELAFKEVPYPGDDNITRCTLKDCLECEEITEYFRGTTWRDHAIEQLQQHQSAITMFTPEALHYFIPGFMLQSLGCWDEADMIPFSIACLFLPTKPDADMGMQEYHTVRWLLFTQRQRQAIAIFLREYSPSAPWYKADIDQAALRLETA